MHHTHVAPVTHTSSSQIRYIIQNTQITYCSFFFFFNDTATTEIYTLSLHDALPICAVPTNTTASNVLRAEDESHWHHLPLRSEEHTSELQSPCNLVCRLLLEKKKIFSKIIT